MLLRLLVVYFFVDWRTIGCPYWPLRRDDTSFVSRTKLESTIYRPQIIVVLRAVLINPLTDRQVLNEIVATQSRIGMEIWQEFEPVYQRLAGDS